MARVAHAESRKPKANFDRMKILRDFMKTNNLTYEDVAAVVGATGPSMNVSVNNKNDIKLSKLVKIFRHYNYTTSILIYRRKEDLNTTVQLDNKTLLSFNGVGMPLLFPLIVAMKRYNISVAKIADSLHVATGSINYYFDKDDISMSRLLQIVDAMDCNLYIKAEEEQRCDIHKFDASRSYICEIRSLFSQEITHESVSGATDAD